MNKKILFEHYHIDESHDTWNNGIDNWMSVEIYRIMHNGKLPENDNSIGWVLDFLDKKNDMKWWVKNVMSRSDWGSLYLTAKRLVRKHADEIIAEKFK